MELGDTFKSIISNKPEEAIKLHKRAEYEDISPLIINGNSSIGNSVLLTTRNAQQTQSFASFAPFGTVQGNNQILSTVPQQIQNLHEQKDNEVLKNSLEIAMKQNLMRTNNIISLQNNSNSTDSINMIFEMISGMMNDKTTNNEQRIVFLFQQFYSLESLLTNTRNELVKLESSIRNNDDDKKSRKQIHELNFEDAFGNEDVHQVGLDNIQKKRHKNL